MSHFLVVVRIQGSVTEDQVESEVAKALAPYQENNMGDCPREYMTFHDTEAEYSEEYENESTEFVFHEGILRMPWDEAFRVPGQIGIGSGSHADPEGSRRVSIQHKLLYPTLETYAKDWHSAERDQETGRYGYWENPQKKWDWWAIGGRWSGYFPIKGGAPASTPSALQEELAQVEAQLKNTAEFGARWQLIQREREIRAVMFEEVRAAQPGVRLGSAGTFGNVPERGHGDIVRKREIDWDQIALKTAENLDKFHDEWTRFIAGEKFDAFDGPESQAQRIGLLVTRQGPPEPGEEDRAIPWSRLVRADDKRRHWHYIYTPIERAELGTKYGHAFSPISGYAYLDETGWHEPGRMGWFGASSDTPETLLANKSDFMTWLKATPEDAWLVAVDCHI